MHHKITTFHFLWRHRLWVKAIARSQRCSQFQAQTEATAHEVYCRRRGSRSCHRGSLRRAEAFGQRASRRHGRRLDFSRRQQGCCCSTGRESCQPLFQVGAGRLLIHWSCRQRRPASRHGRGHLHRRAPLPRSLCSWQHGRHRCFFRYDNGDIFEGTFANNAFSQGRYTLKDDGSYFEGTFKNGQPDQGDWFDKQGNKL